MQLAVLPMAQGAPAISMPFCLAVPTAHTAAPAAPSAASIATQLVLRQHQQQQMVAAAAALSAASGPAASPRHSASGSRHGKVRNHCPCCDGSCERDAREILRGRGAAHGSEEEAGKISVVCIGDSITAGVGATEARSTYPAHLQRLLGDDYVVTNLGACGAAMQRGSDLPYRKRLQWQAAQKVRADIIVIMLGTNDARPPNWNGPSRALQYEADYKALIDVMRANNSPDLKIHVAVPPPFYGHSAPAGSSVAAVNVSVKAVVNDIFPTLVPQIAQNMCLPTTPIPVFEALGGRSLSRPDLFPDGCHPNDDGYLLLAHTVLAALGMEPVPVEMQRAEQLVAPGAEPRAAPKLPGQQRHQQQQMTLATQAALQHHTLISTASAGAGAASTSLMSTMQQPVVPMMHAHQHHASTSVSAVATAAAVAAANGFMTSPMSAKTIPAAFDASQVSVVAAIAPAMGATVPPPLTPLASRSPMRRTRASTLDAFVHRHGGQHQSQRGGQQHNQPSSNQQRPSTSSRSRSTMYRSARNQRGSGNQASHHHHGRRQMHRMFAGQSHMCLSGRTMAASTPADWSTAVPVALVGSR
mmetsp:Transcript_6088/g.17615  ORF Transcript_6088/g.17615 Transcript_6088/m.17615 type:complete len:584 (-) Transcript_6088:229-1980(-)